MTKDLHPDYKYVRALLDNDHQLVAKIYQDFFPRIKNLITRNSGSQDDAYDIFQEGLMVIYNKARESDFQLTSSFFSFLYGICSRLWLKQLRKKSHQKVTLDDEMEFKDDFDLEDAIALRDKRNLLKTKFNLLKERCQQILRLTLLDRKSHQEVAEAMGFANANVAKKEKSKCKSRLVKLVMEDPLFEELR